MGTGAILSWGFGQAHQNSKVRGLGRLTSHIVSSVLPEGTRSSSQAAAVSGRCSIGKDFGGPVIGGCTCLTSRQPLPRRAQTSGPHSPPQVPRQGRARLQGLSALSLTGVSQGRACSEVAGLSCYAPQGRGPSDSRKMFAGLATVTLFAAETCSVEWLVPKTTRSCCRPRTLLLMVWGSRVTSRCGHSSGWPPPTLDWGQEGLWQMCWQVKGPHLPSPKCVALGTCSSLEGPFSAGR